MLFLSPISIFNAQFNFDAKLLNKFFSLVLETLVRLCTRDDNVDLILATRPFKRQQKLIHLLFENIQQVICDQFLLAQT